jgi:quaternary ammonium compound-resistance protein SugE
MSWFILIVAGIFECFWAIGLKYTNGFTKLWPTMFTIVTMAISVALLSIAMKSIPIGTAYAIWTGIGAASVAILGIILFNEPRDLPRLFCILLIIIGVIGLKYFSHSHA